MLAAYQSNPYAHDPCVCVCAQCQAEHAAQSVKDAAGATTAATADAAGAAADTAQLQQHRAADAVQEVYRNSDAAAYLYISLPCKM